MTCLPVLTYPNPILRKKAVEITQFDQQLTQLANDMLETLYDEEATGLAANQVGILQRIVVIDPSDQGHDPLIFVNPRITATNGIVKSREGCLSLPDIYNEINRAAEIDLAAQDLTGKPFIMEGITGLLARCLQHEIDHLNGVLSFDHLSPLKKQFVLKKLKKMAAYQA